MGTIAAFFKLIRWPNLLLLGLVQFSVFECLAVQIHYYKEFTFFEQIGILSGLHSYYDWLWVVMPPSILIAAAGYVVNDIYDQAIDQINKPQKQIVGKGLSTKVCWGIYGLLNIIALGWPILYSDFSWQLELFFAIVIGVLWAYSRYLKQMTFWGNLLVAALAAASVFVIYADVWSLKATSWFSNNQFYANYADYQQVNTKVYMAHLLFSSYAAFAFFSTLIREQIKDLEDRFGDQQAGAKTMAVRFSLRFNKQAIYVSSFLLAIWILALGIICGVAGYFLLLLYSYLLLLIGLLALVYGIYISQEKFQFSRLSRWIKIYMLLGLGLLWCWYIIV